MHAFRLHDGREALAVAWRTFDLVMPRATKCLKLNGGRGQKLCSEVVALRRSASMIGTRIAHSIPADSAAALSCHSKPGECV